MDRFERRLERILREIGRTILQATLRELETDQVEDAPARIHWQGDAYRRNRMTNKTVDTRFGQITLRRWFYQSTEPGEPGIAPLDLRLGLYAGRMTPAVTEVVGRLAADLPQQAVLELLRERFAITPGVATLRRVVSDLAEKVRSHHDEAAMERLTELIEKARQSEGKHEPLLQVGRDGVFVQTRPCWEEASCGTLAVYDRSRRRLGTVYLGEMPESEQPTMTARLTNVITGTLTRLGRYVPKLRYVTDAGCHPQAYFRHVLQPMKHPTSGESLRWSWGVDFYHACEYVSKLAAALFGSGEAASSWAAKQRQTLRTKAGGVARRSKGRSAKTSARPERSQEGLRLRNQLPEDLSPLHGLRGTKAGRRSDRQRDHRGGMQSDFQSAIETIGNALAPRNGATHRGPADGGAKRAVASIWQRLLSQFGDLPPIICKQPPQHFANARKTLLLS